MKAEERKHLQQNELQTKLESAWSGMSSTSPQSNRIWAGILLGLVALVVVVYFVRSNSEKQSDLWSALDFAWDTSALEKIAKDNPSTTQGHVARFHLARIRAVEGLSTIGVTNGEERAEAARKLEEVRTIYGELTRVSGLPAEMTQEALGQLGRTEEVLASVPKLDDPKVMRGSLDTALKHYDDLKARYPNCYFATQAAKRAEEIRTHKADIEKLYLSLADIHAKSPASQLPINVTPADPLPTTLPK